MTISYLTVCSGIEAPSQAWHPLGWRAVGFSEIEPFPCAVLSARWGASRPWHMPQPDDVPTHDETGQPRPPRRVDKERRARASAIKAVAHLPQQAEVPNFGDMSRFREWPDDTAFDVLAGGTPCQSFSVAGLRKGLADPRGNLMLTYGHIAARFRPRWVVWENVPGVLSSAGGSDFGSFLGLLSGRSIAPPPDGWQNSGIVPGIADAYGLAWRVLDAQYLRTCGLPFAVPQRRRRVVVVGYLGDWRRAAAVLFDRESLSGNPPPRRQTGQGHAPTISAHPSGGGGLGTDFDLDGGLIADRVVSNSGDVSYCLTASAQQSLDAETETVIAVAHALRGEGFDASEDGTGRGVPLVAWPLTSGMAASASRMPHEQGTLVPICFSGNDYGADAIVNLAPTLRVGGHGNEGGAVPPAVAFAENKPGEIRLSDVAPQLNTGGEKPGQGYAAIAIQERAGSENPQAGPDGAGFSDKGTAYTLEARSNVQAVATTWVVRRLMPVECERLMGMADGYTAIPWRGKPAPDGPRYKAIGNSWATTLAEWLGERIQEVDSWP